MIEFDQSDDNGDNEDLIREYEYKRLKNHSKCIPDIIEEYVDDDQIKKKFFSFFRESKIKSNVIPHIMARYEPSRNKTKHAKIIFELLNKHYLKVKSNKK